MKELMITQWMSKAELERIYPNPNRVYHPYDPREWFDLRLDGGDAAQGPWQGWGIGPAGPAGTTGAPAVPQEPPAQYCQHKCACGKYFNHEQSTKCPSHCKFCK